MHVGEECVFEDVRSGAGAGVHPVHKCPGVVQKVGGNPHDLEVDVVLLLLKLGLDLWCVVSDVTAKLWRVYGRGYQG